MDVEILNGRLAATETSVLEIDQRLDALAGMEEARNARFTTLEETLSQCLEKLTAVETSLSKNSVVEERILEAEAEKVEAEAREAEADAEIAEQLAETLSEPISETVVETSEETPEETTDEGITELEPEPPSAEEEGRATKSQNWLERFLLVR